MAIQVVDISKKYDLGGPQVRYQTFRDSISRAANHSFSRLRNRLLGHDVPVDGSKNSIWALRNISFQLDAGEVVGVIGRNGAGKSTLLKILSRITEPTEGFAEIHGRIGSLLEVGTGFHPELTGRENVYLYGAILGMKRDEIGRKFDEIVAFAELERFLETPVKHYSSGMYVRLAFAVAAHLETEILLVDEVLAVGDVQFQKKCLGKMENVAHEGRTVILVSHQMNAIQSLCPKSLLLEQGQLIYFGDSRSAIGKYLSDHTHGSMWDGSSNQLREKNPFFNPTKFLTVDPDLQPVSHDVAANEKIGILIEGNVDQPHAALSIGFAVSTASGELIFWAQHTDTAPENWPLLTKGRNTLVAWIPTHYLNEGDYRAELMCSLHFQEWFLQPGVNSPMISFRIRGGLSKSPHWILARPGLTAPIIPFEKIEDINTLAQTDTPS